MSSCCPISLQYGREEEKKNQTQKKRKKERFLIFGLQNGFQQSYKKKVFKKEINKPRI
jgi:hypothetical protein